MCLPMWAHWRHLANTIELVFLRPTPDHSPNGKSTRSAILAQLTAESPYTYNGLFFSPPKKIAPCHGGSGPPSNIWFPVPTRVLNPNGISILSSRFCTDDRRVSLYFTMGPPQNCPFPWGIWTPSNTCFPRPTRVINPNGISIGSTVLQGSLM